MNLAKIFFYLFFYLHIVACYWWIFLGYNAPERYYSNSELNAYYQYSVDGSLGEPFQIDGKTMEVNGTYIMWGKYTTFKNTTWNYFTAEDRPDWKETNEMFDSAPNYWYAPLDWVNYVD